MNVGQIKEASCSPTVCAEKFLPFINEACDQYEINTPVRQLCFLVQVGHESGGLFYTEELASGILYEGRKNLGNTRPGDGVRFKGRGLIQITGRSNYESLSDAFGIDFIKNPTSLGGKNVKVSSPEQLRYSALSAGWFWNSRKLNALADQINIKKPIDTLDNLETFKAITKKINGGHNGLPDRLNRYRIGVKYFV
jgi:putative chitinase